MALKKVDFTGSYSLYVGNIQFRECGAHVTCTRRFDSNNRGDLCSLQRTLNKKVRHIEK